MSDQKNSTSWKRRGFGWVPDLPDVRDFTPVDVISQPPPANPHKSGSNDNQQFVETILSRVVQILQTAGEHSSENVRNQLQSYAETLSQSILNDFSFTEAKVYRILRLNVVHREVVKLKHTLHRFSERDTFAGQFNLRRQLSSSAEDDYFEWLDNPRLDEKMDKAVRLFQTAVNQVSSARAKSVTSSAPTITVDGIVGLETYLIIEQFLENAVTPVTPPTQSIVESIPSQPQTILPKAATKLSIDSQPIREQSQTYRPKENTAPQLITFPSLIPLEAYTPILNAVRLLWLYSKDQLKETQIQSLKHKTREEVEELITEHTNTLKTQPILALGSNQGVNLQEFVELLNSHFSDIEPMMAIAIMSICPLARFTDLHEVVYTALLEFHQILTTKANPKEDSEDRENLRFMGQAAIAQVLSNVKWARENGILQTKNKSSDQDMVSSFYESVETIARKYATVRPKPNQKNEFSKEVLLQIVNPTSQSPLDSTPNSLLLNFATSQLQLPFSSHLYRLKSFVESQNKHHYMFLPGVVDLSYWCSQIEDQGNLNACTAFAGVALLEYFSQRNLGDYTELSPLFLYKAARNLMERSGDVGASVRQTMKALVLFGIPPERYWPYQEEIYDDEPPAFCYAYAQNFQGLKYFRLDSSDLDRETLLLKIKATLAAGFPCIFGFTVYSSALRSENIQAGYFPIPSQVKDKVVAGHSVVAVGYSDFKSIKYADRTNESKGALLVRNCWGIDWGKEGYGWLPYDYVLQGITADWWSLVKAEWLQEGYFGLGARDPGTYTQSWP